MFKRRVHTIESNAPSTTNVPDTHPARTRTVWGVNAGDKSHNVNARMANITEYFECGLMGLTAAAVVRDSFLLDQEHNPEDWVIARLIFGASAYLTVKGSNTTVHEGHTLNLINLAKSSVEDLIIAHSTNPRANVQTSNNMISDVPNKDVMVVARKLRDLLMTYRHGYYEPLPFVSSLSSGVGPQGSQAIGAQGGYRGAQDSQAIGPQGMTFENYLSSVVFPSNGEQGQRTSRPMPMPSLPSLIEAHKNGTFNMEQADSESFHPRFKMIELALNNANVTDMEI